MFWQYLVCFLTTFKFLKKDIRKYIIGVIIWLKFVPLQANTFVSADHTQTLTLEADDSQKEIDP